MRTEDALADLAEATLALAREIEHRHDPSSMVALTPTERLVMRAIDVEDGLPPSTIAERLGLQRSNVSAALRGLERKGLVSTAGDAADGRGRRLHATELARTNLAGLRRRWAATLEGTVDGADAARLARAVTAIGDLLVERRRLGEG